MPFLHAQPRKSPDIDRRPPMISVSPMDDGRRKLNRELELIQTIGHLLQKAGEADAEVAICGWALENAGRVIVSSAAEIREALDEGESFAGIVHGLSRSTSPSGSASPRCPCRRA
jgi:hypothetical protein